MRIASAPRFRPQASISLLDGAERVVEIAHEHAAHGVDHEHVGAVRRLEQAGAAPGRAFRKIDGPEQTVMPLDEDQRLALIPDMIAGGHDVGAGIEKLGQDLLGDAEAAGRVLAIDHDEIRAHSASRNPGRVSMTAARPERPTTSPRNTIRILAADPKA